MEQLVRHNIIINLKNNYLYKIVEIKLIKFNKNKIQTFKYKANITGAGSNPKITPRLILSPKNSSAKLFFEGKYDSGECIIEIQHDLNLLPKGEVLLEIITNNTIFQPWKDEYEVVAEKIVVEGVELIDNDSKIMVEIEKPKTKKNKIEENIFNKSVKNKTKQLVLEYIDKTKNIKNKKDRNELLKHILHQYKPNNKILEWGGRVFLTTNAPKAKIAMYYAELKHKQINENENLNKLYPEIEEWKKTKNGSYLDWFVVTKKPWNQNKAEQFQSKAGYSPFGYDFFKFKSTKNIDGTYTNTWKCAATS